MGKRLVTFLKGEAVLCAAALCAVISMFFVPPSAAYLSYIDLRVLCLLLCLMATVAGLQLCGVFRVLAQRLLAGEKHLRVLSLLLVLLPFFTSMLITNDVALITFVPFTLLVLEMAGVQERVLPIVILQTMAANLGSMATPGATRKTCFYALGFPLMQGCFCDVAAICCYEPSSVGSGGIDRTELENPCYI